MLPAIRPRAGPPGERPRAGPVHNNCSGKHAGFLALTRFLGAEPASCLDFGFPARRWSGRRWRSDGSHAEELGVAVDGCSAPTFRTP